MTSPRGGGHLDGATTFEGGSLDSELSNAVYGIPNVNDASAYEHKAKFVVWMQKLKILIDMLGMCCFVSAWTGPHGLVAEDLAQLYAQATGDSKSGHALLTVAEKAINVEKAFNTLHAGFTRNDDYPPPRLLSEPVKSGKQKGAVIDLGEWNKMLDDYYEFHGWDKDTGLQTGPQLREIGLEEIANRLRREGRLINK